MRKSTTLALLAAGTLSVTACGGDSSTGRIISASAPYEVSASKSVETSRPIKGSCTITSTDFVSFAFPILNQVGHATCQISHLGRATLRSELAVNVATGTQTGASTFTAANGDLLYVTSAGSSTPTGPSTISFTGITTIVGGTGRFENATGQLNASGTTSFSGTGFLMYDGSIVY